VLPRDCLLEREQDVPRSLRQRDDVVGARLEHALHKPVRRGLAEDDDGTIGPLLHHAVDEDQRPLGVAVAGDDDQVDLGFLKRGPALLQPVDECDDLDVGALGESVLDRVPIDPGVERDECRDAPAHGRPPKSRRAWP
jgi:hypothetical protein